MTVFNVELKLGAASFSAQAENEGWITEQLDKFIELLKTSPQESITAISNAGAS